MRDLTKFNTDELAERLVEFARVARKSSIDRDVFALHDLLMDVRAAADLATGPSLLLLEIAEAFLRALARTDLGRTEMGVRRFFVEHAAAAEALFAKLANGSVVAEADVERYDPAVRLSIAELVDLGALAMGPHGYTLRASLTSFALDLLEPLALRMWRHVQTARRTAQGSAKREEQAAAVASSLGIGQAEALRHLDANPLDGGASALPRHAQPGTLIASRRGRVLYSRRAPVPEESGPASVPSTPLTGGSTWTQAQRFDEIIAQQTRQGYRRSQGERAVVFWSSVLN